MITNLSEIRAAHQQLSQDTRRATLKELADAGKFAKKHVSRYAKFKHRSGKLRRSAKAKPKKSRGGGSVRLRWTARHASFLEYGTRPHVIKPKRAKALRFTVGGSVVFARRVQHPGTKPYKFGWKAAHAAHRRLGNRMTRRMQALAKRF